MTIEEQLELWVEGVSIHNQERDECCPDFSCCRGNIVPKPERERFMVAVKRRDMDTMADMLIGFIHRAHFLSVNRN